MVPLFNDDVDGRKLHNKYLLPRRNWCGIQMCDEGESPSYELDVALNVEVNRRNAEGKTKAYHIKVPTLSS